MLETVQGHATRRSSPPRHDHRDDQTADGSGKDRRQSISQDRARTPRHRLPAEECPGERAARQTDRLAPNLDQPGCLAMNREE
jgi:hypothetical protein